MLSDLITDLIRAKTPKEKEAPTGGWKNSALTDSPLMSPLKNSARRCEREQVRSHRGDERIPA